MNRNTMQKIYLILIVLFVSGNFLFAQELNIKLTINGDQIHTTDKSGFDQMQESLNQLIKTRKWTD